MSNEVAAHDANLARMQQMAQQANTGTGNSAPQIPKLAINQSDITSPHPVGSYVLGKKFGQNGDVVDPGKKVEQIIILAVRNGYSLYDQDNRDNNCASPYFEDYREQVRGWNHGYVCGKTCPHRAADIKPRCAAQIVVMGIAFYKDENGEMQDSPFIWYVKKSAYKPVLDYINNTSNFTVRGSDGQSYQMKPFMFVTGLSTEGHRNGSVNYFVPILKTGEMLEMGLAEAMYQKVEESNNIFAYMSNQIEGKAKDKGAAAPHHQSSPGAATPEYQVPPAQTTTPSPAKPEAPVYDTSAAPAPPSPQATAPDPAPAGAPAAGGDDLRGSIMAALGKN